ncbi:unnamed protein product [Ostreobium quekettii]|uniref:Peptidase S54 rhomboid domain-containing protein n=1 Tax=Ostreobium quekettii TaxID=121088 RepID=A0A8S1ISH4_9CHLO|nr:unnamed protein product [Ostreobium quekettii]
MAAATSYFLCALLTLLLALAIYFNPDEASFVALVTSHVGKKGGYWAGLAAHVVSGFQSKLGVAFHLHNLLVCSFLKYMGRWYLGAFGLWIPMPSHPALDWASESIKQWRLTVVEGLIALNLLVFVLWLLLPARVMANNFEVSKMNLQHRPWAVFAANFSHDSPIHLLANLQMLSIIGPHLRTLIGSKAVFLVYTLGGMGAQAASLAGNSYMNRAAWTSKGASGAVYALLACNAVLDRGWTVYLAPFGLHSTPLGMLTVRLAIDMLAACMGGAVDFWAHIGGTATGLLYMKYLHAGEVIMGP